MNQIILFLFSSLNLLNKKKNITGNTYNIGAGEEGNDANKVGKN